MRWLGWRLEVKIKVKIKIKGFDRIYRINPELTELLVQRAGSGAFQAREVGG